MGGPKHAGGSQGHGGGAMVGTITGHDCSVAAVAGSGGPGGFGIRALQRNPSIRGDDGAPRCMMREVREREGTRVDVILAGAFNRHDQL